MIDVAPTGNERWLARWAGVRRGRYIVAAGVVWLLLLGCGWAFLLSYTYQTAEVLAAPPSWPTESRLPLRPGQPTLLVFVHPHCPCSQASLSELERLATRIHDAANTIIVFTKPPGAKIGWEQGSLWRRAARLPGAITFLDHNAIESHRFHAQSSGEALLYDRHGRLAFHGGITAGRGHEGDNSGSAAIRNVCAGTEGQLATSPVFGCPLHADL